MPKEKDKQSNFELIQRIREEGELCKRCKYKISILHIKAFFKKSSIEVYYYGTCKMRLAFT
jgi:hypothetical protein